jgi:formate dehydrogenase subunit gamma
MTATRTSVAPTASEHGTVPRFGPTERAVHWVHASAFFGLLATGLALYLPPLASLVGDRPLLKAMHLATASLWVTALLALTAAGDRRRLGRTRRDLERFLDDDVAWLRGRPSRPGRFNAGQKLHAALQAALAVLFLVTGTLLWLGERDTSLRFAGTIPVHDACTLAAIVLVGGHLYMALVNEGTRPALRGMVDGRVEARFATEHHPAWTPDAERDRRPTAWAVAMAGAIVLAGLLGSVALVLDVLG